MSEFATSSDINRLEEKIDDVGKAIKNLILIEERQTNQAAALSTLRADLAAMQKAQAISDKRLDSWINRGVGAWALATVVWAVLTKVSG